MPPREPPTSRSPTWPTVTSNPRLDAMLAPENSFFRPSAGERRSGAQPSAPQPPPRSCTKLPGPSASLDSPKHRACSSYLPGPRGTSRPRRGHSCQGQTRGPCEAFPARWPPWEGPPWGEPCSSPGGRGRQCLKIPRGWAWLWLFLRGRGCGASLEPRFAPGLEPVPTLAGVSVCNSLGINRISDFMKNDIFTVKKQKTKNPSSQTCLKAQSHLNL